MIPVRGRRGGCLGPEAADYVAGRFGPERRSVVEHHLVTCAGCRAEVEAERRLHDRLGTGPAMSGALHAALLSLAAAPLPTASLPRQAPAAPAAPVRPAPVAHLFAVPQAPELAPLPVVALGAPACHRSAARSAAVAVVVAGASAAAAWSLAVVGAGVAPRPAPPVSRAGAGGAQVVTVTSVSSVPSGCVTALTAAWQTRVHPFESCEGNTP